MATLLRKLRVRRIDLVDKGANFDPVSGEGAHVLLYKRADAPLDDCGVCKAELHGETRGDLKDSDFAAVWTNSDGKKQRKLPIHDAAHVRNALARFNQTDMPAEVKAKAKAKLEAAKRKFGIGDEAKKAQPTASDVHVDTMGDKPMCKKCDEPMKKQGDMMTCPKCGATLSKADRPKEETMELEKLQADLKAAEELATEEQTKRVEVEKNLKTATDELAVLKAEVAALKAKTQTPEELEKARFAAIPAEIKKQLEDNAAEIKKMKDEKDEREHIEKARPLAEHLSTTPQKLGRLLKMVKDKAPEALPELETLLKATSEQIRTGDLYKEFGSGADSGVPETAYEEMLARANQLMKSSGGTLKEDEAIAKVAKNDPALYRRYTLEARANAAQ